MEVEFTYYGEPQGKARPRFNGKTHRTYTPIKTKHYEEDIRDACYIEAGYKGQRFIEKEPLSVFIEAYFSIPKSATKTAKFKMFTGEIKPCKKPDADNIAKSVLDSISGKEELIPDDAQVTYLSVRKIYTADEPRVRVRILQNE